MPIIHALWHFAPEPYGSRLMLRRHESRSTPTAPNIILSAFRPDAPVFHHQLFAHLHSSVFWHVSVEFGSCRRREKIAPAPCAEIILRCL